MKMTKISPIHQAQAKMLMAYFRKFTTWPESLQNMLNNWGNGFDPRTRKKDLKIVMNHLAETGEIRFEIDTTRKLHGIPAPEIVFFLNDGEQAEGGDNA